jgi:hypothetical protein
MNYFSKSLLTWRARNTCHGELIQLVSKVENYKQNFEEYAIQEYLQVNGNIKYICRILKQKF